CRERQTRPARSRRRDTGSGRSSSYSPQRRRSPPQECVPCPPAIHGQDDGIANPGDMGRVPLLSLRTREPCERSKRGVVPAPRLQETSPDPATAERWVLLLRRHLEDVAAAP